MCRFVSSQLQGQIQTWTLQPPIQTIANPWGVCIQIHSSQTRPISAKDHWGLSLGSHGPFLAAVQVSPRAVLMLPATVQHREQTQSSRPGSFSNSRAVTEFSSLGRLNTPLPPKKKNTGDFKLVLFEGSKHNMSPLHQLYLHCNQV